MKQKHILITYLNNGDFAHIGPMNAVLQNLTEALEAEGKRVRMRTAFFFGSLVTFTDDSTIKLLPLNLLDPDKGRRHTHIYVDRSVSERPFHQQLLEKALLSHLMGEGDGPDFSTEGQQLFHYWIEDRTLHME